MDTANKAPLPTQNAKRTEINGGNGVSEQVQQYRFDFWALPLELRLMIYGYCHLTAEFTIDTKVLVKYFKGRPTHICSLLDAARTIRAEAFQAVLQQNRINIIGLKQNKGVSDYINETQIHGFSLWGNIRRVKLTFKSDSTLIAAARLLPMCLGLRSLEVEFPRWNALKATDLCNNLHKRSSKLNKAIEQMSRLEKIIVIQRELHVTYMLHTLLSNARLPNGSLNRAPYRWEHGLGPAV